MANRIIVGANQVPNKDLTYVRDSFYKDAGVTDLDASNTDITSLKGAPEVVTNRFTVLGTNIESLAYSPKEVYIYDCSRCWSLKSLLGVHRITGRLECSIENVLPAAIAGGDIVIWTESGNNRVGKVQIAIRERTIFKAKLAMIQAGYKKYAVIL